MKNSYPYHLTDAEANRLRAWIDKNGGQAKASAIIGASIGTLSRTINGHTAPTPLFRQRLVELGVIKP